MAIYHKLLNSIDMEKLKILNLNFSFQRAAHYHINGGMLLMGVVLLAMFLANSPWGDIYASFWNYEVHLQIGEFNFFSRPYGRDPGGHSGRRPHHLCPGRGQRRKPHQKRHPGHQ